MACEARSLGDGVETSVLRLSDVPSLTVCARNPLLPMRQLLFCSLQLILALAVDDALETDSNRFRAVS